MIKTSEPIRTEAQFILLMATNGKEAQMTFKEEYPIDFNDIHKVIDTISISKSKVFVRLLKDGNPVPFEKQIDL